MKKSILILIPLFFLFFLNDKLFCIDNNESVARKTIIDLSQGCKLVLDTSIDVSDSLSVEIINGIRELLPRVQALIPADSVTINLAISSIYILPVWGVGGRTICDDSGVSIDFYFDPKHPNFKAEYILRSLAHELNHACRMRMPQYQLTLLECMVNEGLADHFMIEVFNCEQSPFSSSLTEEQIQQFMIQVKPIMRDTFESWSEEFNENYFVPYMFGRTGEDPIPNWAGYSLGWVIVENYLKDHPEARSSSLIFTLPEEIVSSTPEFIVNDENHTN
jgi:hypothetical protein